MKIPIVGATGSTGQQLVDRDLAQDHEVAALASGFANQSHFTKCFRQLIGVTSKAYRGSSRE